MGFGHGKVWGCWGEVGRSAQSVERIYRREVNEDGAVSFGHGTGAPGL